MTDGMLLVYRPVGGRGIAWLSPGPAVSSGRRPINGVIQMPQPDRRQVLRRSAAATVGILTGPILAADAKADSMPIIDTHQHLWDLNRFRLPWVKPGTFLGRRYLPGDYH